MLYVWRLSPELLLEGVPGSIAAFAGGVGGAPSDLFLIPIGDAVPDGCDCLVGLFVCSHCNLHPSVIDGRFFLGIENEVLRLNEINTVVTQTHVIG